MDHSTGNFANLWAEHMSFLTVTAINVLNNPAPFLAPLEFEVHYEAILDLEEGIVPIICLH